MQPFHSIFELNFLHQGGGKITNKAHTTSKMIEQRQQAPRKHGLYAVRDRGTDAMTETQRTRYGELRSLVLNETGRIELWEHLTARLGVMVDIGFDELRRVKEEGGDLWKAPVTKTLATYLNTLVRLLRDFPVPSGAFYGDELRHIEKVIEDVGPGETKDDGSSKEEAR